MEFITVAPKTLTLTSTKVELILDVFQVFEHLVFFLHSVLQTLLNGIHTGRQTCQINSKHQFTLNSFCDLKNCPLWPFLRSLLFFCFSASVRRSILWFFNVAAFWARSSSIMFWITYRNIDSTYGARSQLRIKVRVFWNEVCLIVPSEPRWQIRWLS